jgi:hypothetical protein
MKYQPFGKNRCFEKMPRMGHFFVDLMFLGLVFVAEIFVPLYQGMERHFCQLFNVV